MDGIETFSMDRVLNKEHFYETKHAENVHQKASRRCLFNFGK